MDKGEERREAEDGIKHYERRIYKQTRKHRSTSWEQWGTTVMFATCKSAENHGIMMMMTTPEISESSTNASVVSTKA